MSGLVDKIKGHNNKGLSQGSKIQSTVALKEDNPTQGTVQLDKLAGKNIIVGVPGAFTPPCSSHVPGYIQDAQKFAEKGIKGIYIVAVNDAFTTQAWKDKLGSESAPIVHFLADDTGNFTKEVGMNFDATGLLGGVRSQRYVAVLDDATVSQIFVEDEAPSVTVTKSDNVLQALN